jgi:hypothetical protein
LYNLLEFYSLRLDFYFRYICPLVLSNGQPISLDLSVFFFADGDGDGDGRPKDGGGIKSNDGLAGDGLTPDTSPKPLSAPAIVDNIPSGKIPFKSLHQKVQNLANCDFEDGLRLNTLIAL